MILSGPHAGQLGILQEKRKDKSILVVAIKGKSAELTQLPFDGVAAISS